MTERTGAPPPGGAGWETLARAAASPSELAPDREGRPLLVVGLGRDLYALPVERVREIVRPRPMTPVPHAPSTVRGVIALRGDIVQVLDLGGCLALAGPGAGCSGPRRRIIVLRGEEGPSVALEVDRVVDVWRAADADLQPAPGGGPEAVAALGLRDGRFVSVVEVDRILEGIDGR